MFKLKHDFNLHFAQKMHIQDISAYIVLLPNTGKWSKLKYNEKWIGSCSLCICIDNKNEVVICFKFMITKPMITVAILCSN